MRDGKRAALAAALLLGAAIATQIVPQDEPAAIARGATASPAEAPPDVRSLRASEDRETSRERSEPLVSDARPRAPAGASRARSLAAAVISAAPPREPADSARPQAESAAGFSFRILLEPAAAATGAVTVGFAGTDTGAPRTLDLWRVAGGRVQRLGRATSDASARIHGPQLALPEAGIELVVTPIGVRPGEPGASQPLRLARAPSAGAAAPAPGGPRWQQAAIDPSSEGGQP